MGYEGFNSDKFGGLRVKTSKHQRSKSFPERSEHTDNITYQSLGTSRRLKLDIAPQDDCVKSDKKLSSKTRVQNSMRQEILQLEKRLQDQISVRSALESALGYRSSTQNINIGTIMSKPATELIKEIAVLELEVTHLEQYLLSLYRQAFDQQVSSISPSAKSERPTSPQFTPTRRHLEFPQSDMVMKCETTDVQTVRQSVPKTRKDSDFLGDKNSIDSGVHRCHSSLSQHSGLPNQSSLVADSLGKALRSCHSQPLSMMEYAQNTSSNIISLAEHLGTRISDHIPDTPNKISEDMIKCISTVYCKLSDPPLTNNGLSSPTSSLSSTSPFSPKDPPSDIWSPGFQNYSSFDVRLDNPFHIEGLKEFSGPYSTMVEIQGLYTDSKKMADIEHLLQKFRSLVARLEEIDPRKMNHENKLAFWINIHNALVMHAFLAYGIPQINMKRVLLLLKAAYNIGGRIISAGVIQNSILGCRISRPGQWLRLLLSSRAKLKAGDDRLSYAIEKPEPLLHFALCSGSHSDPAVRIYTPKRVFQELEIAKEEYMRATFGVRKDKKVLLPKLIESFAKDSALCPAGLMEMIQQTLPESLRKTIKKCQQGKSRKNIEFVPHNFAFRYLIVNELVK
ncbi:hypothetical protein Leryth_013649 [Lithospermum erythrorhizon]|nr:hypothetical protein Leryth_013649 [Lithospermum erythrorhizon]